MILHEYDDVTRPESRAEYCVLARARLCRERCDNKIVADNIVVKVKI